MKPSRKIAAVAAASAAALALSVAPAQAQSVDSEQLTGSIQAASVDPVPAVQGSLLFPLVGSFFLGCGIAKSLGSEDNGGCTF